MFIRLWRTADRFDAERAKLVTWVMLIARRHMIDRLRRKKTRPTTQITCLIPSGMGRTKPKTQPKSELNSGAEWNACPSSRKKW